MVPALIPDPDRQSSDKLDKPRQILQGAMQEFLARGYAAASMDRIAAAAGVSKATVYSHFGDKERLFIALVEQMAQERMREIMGLLDRTLEPRLALRQLIQSALKDCCTNYEFHDFKRVLVGESGRFPELAKTFIAHLTKPGIEALADYLRDCPEFNFPDPEAIARIIIGAIVHFALVQHILHGDELMPMEADRIAAGLELLLFPSDSIAHSNLNQSLPSAHRQSQ
jgi:TetR/AcrR family transcriptional regulator, regulator of autoinduction and epiphytic fitness